MTLTAPERLPFGQTKAQADSGERKYGVGEAAGVQGPQGHYHVDARFAQTQCRFDEGHSLTIDCVSEDPR